MRVIRFLLVLLVSAGASAQSIQELQDQMKSMQACRLSLKNKDCNLKILDSGIKQTLIELDRLNKERALLSGGRANQAVATGDVRFFADTISEADGEILRLLGGSVWMLDRDYFGLPLEEVVGIATNKETATIYANDNVYTGKLLKGYIATSTGFVGSVVDSKGDGTVLQLDNGALLEFSSYDKFDTGYWLPPYRVLINSEKTYMWNLEEGKKVDIKSVLK